ncbi:hypothetical protein GALL_545060 [mine drainage metagenome]|uniref:Uncharacterized protein n=1 Tax=mine drainage metagenome TaxID=410659 RepID=A0A1J5NXG9_9ZZZZ
MRVDLVQFGENQAGIFNSSLTQANEGQRFQAEQVEMLRGIHPRPVAAGALQQPPVGDEMRLARSGVQG